MSNTNCKYRQEMIQRLLSEESVAEPSARDIEHAKKCSECAEAIRKICSVEAKLTGHFAEIRTIVSSEKPVLSQPPWKKNASLPSAISKNVEESIFAGWLRPILLGMALCCCCLFLFKMLVPVSESRKIEIQSQTASNQSRIIDGVLLAADGGQITANQSFSIPKDGVHCVGKCRLALSDKVDLAMNRAKIRQAADGIALESGFVEVNVHKKGTPFSVIAPSVILGVRGTVFSVECLDMGETSVMVKEGIVAAKTVSGEEKLLSASQRIRVDRSGHIIEPASPVSVNDSSAASHVSSSVSTNTPVSDSSSVSANSNNQSSISSDLNQ
ncbi:MAG: FecR domain-containing protein [Candidatus Riflebacteria bacterium]|nr:FecR domain-containing protein [Candidatus Riflebacteria bacterium]